MTDSLLLGWLLCLGCGLLGNLLRWFLGCWLFSCLLGGLLSCGFLGGLLWCLGLLGSLLGGLLGGGFLSGLLGSLGLLGGGFLCLLLLLGLGLLAKLEGSGCAGSLDLLQSSAGDARFQETADEGDDPVHIDLVVGGHVFLDGGEGRSLAVLQGGDGCGHHGGHWRVGGGCLGFLGYCLLCWCCVRHDEVLKIFVQ